MPWGAAAAAAGSALGGYLGGKQSKHANDPMNPMDMYAGAAKSGVAGLNTDIGNLQGKEYYPDSTVAGMNPYLSNSIASMGAFGGPGGRGSDIANLSYNAGRTGLEAMSGGIDLMDSLRNQPGGPFQYNQGVYDTTMNNLMPSLQGSYDAASRDNNRQLNWNTLPGINMAGNASGQQGASKGGQQSALATGMTMDRNADIGASLYTNAVNTANTNAMNAGARNLDANLNMVNQYGSYGQVGGNIANQSFNQSLGGYDAGLTAGKYQQGYDQSVLDDSVARFNFDQDSPYNLISDKGDLYNMFRGSGARPGQSGGGAFEGAVQGAQLGAGIYGAGKDAGWWGTPSAPQATWGIPSQSSTELRPFDTSGYGAMRK